MAETDAEVQKPPTVKDLVSEYRKAWIDSTDVTTLNALTPEEKVAEEQRNKDGERRMEELYPSIISAAVDEFLAAPAEQRMGYLTNLRENVLRPRGGKDADLPTERMFDFQDRFAVRLTEKLTQPSDNSKT